MVASCCICKLESGQREDVSFHRIPKNEERKRQWLLAIGREVGKYSAVCSLHFAPNDFYNICEGSYRRLLLTAVPSAALPSVTQSIQKFENGSAVSKDFTASDKSQENHGESLHLMPTTSRLFDNTAMPLIEPANVPLCVQKISEPAVAPEQTHKRKWEDMCSKSAKHAKRVAVPRYIGDIGPDDFKSNMSWLIVEKYVNNVRPKLKMLNQTIRRLKKRVNSMSDMLKRVRGKGLLSTEATNALSAKSMKALKKKNAPVEKSVSELHPWPSYIQDRIALWDKLKKEYEDAVAAKTPVDITVTLPDGKKVPAQSWRSTPYDVAKSISQGLADNTVISKVNNQLWDLDRPLEYDCKLQLLKFDDSEGQQVFWHSSAHILGEAMERVYGGCLCYGPPIENGFYYDMYLGEKGISNLDFPYLEGLYKNIVKEKQSFERLEMTKEDLLEMFKYNEFKVRIINERIHTPTTTAYRCGPLIDLCRGPHVRHTGKIKAMRITKNSSTYWEGNANAESLQRVYGISFPDTKQLKEWEKFQEEAAKRDHRKIGKEQELYFFHELSPGSCFFQPRGAYIYNTLIDFIRSEYRKRGFQEVITPNIFNSKLWQTSGHWQHYAENMFSFDVEKETFALKPMNCPGHCMMFDIRNRSWRELPLRFADFGVLHRNELSGALTGLTRVRRFQQDDAHMFCAIEQIKDEISGALDFLSHVYSVLGFTFNLCLSTRPEKFLGDISLWNDAEKALEESLNAFGQPWTLNPEDGAFYGPKIDITIMDALKRPHQTATIQLDFQLPIRFNLSYVNETGEKTRPVIIHRAILGSVERMIAILTESYGGKWPYWLSPRQAMVVPVASQFDEYAYEVKQKLWNAGVMVEIDTDPSDTLNKKIRNAQLAQFNFILVVGEKERNAGTVNIRTRDNVVHGEMAVDELIAKLKILKETKDLNSELKP